MHMGCQASGEPVPREKGAEVVLSSVSWPTEQLTLHLIKSIVLGILSSYRLMKLPLQN